MAFGQEFLAQFLEIVDLSVEDYPERAVLVGDGLVAGGEVYDGEPAHGEAHVLALVVALVVRAAVDEQVVHGLQVLPGNGQARAVII